MKTKNQEPSTQHPAPNTQPPSYLQTYGKEGILRFLTCGSVDDGKSTLIGRLLYDTKMVFEDQLAAVERESKKYGTTGGKLDLALLVDGLQSEREQGITIDVAYRYFATEKRKYIIADTPGHEQYTRNMVTGASTADVAVILIDARKGILTQTRRHSYIVNLLGIRHVIVAINKMDLVGYDEAVYRRIDRDYRDLAGELGIEHVLSVPLSALEGDNVVHPGTHMLWYGGRTLLEYLDSIEIGTETSPAKFRFPVQYVNRPHLDFRGYCGTIASGSVRVGDEITVLPSGRTTRVKGIIDAGEIREDRREVHCREASAPRAITLTIEDEIDISRGDMIVHSHALPPVSNTLKVMLVWMSETPLEPGREYEIKRATTTISGYVERINYRIDVDTYRREKADRLHLNDIASCRMVLSRPLAVDPYRENRQTGSFIVIDRHSNETVGAGMIVDVARRPRDRVEEVERIYSDAERELNAYIRKHYPEWGCKAI